MHLRSLTLVVLPLVGAATIALSAQSKTFDAERNRLHQEAAAARKARNMDLLDPKLQNEFPPAAIQPVKVQKVPPGGSISIALAGIIPAGVAILSDRDGAVLSAPSLSRSSYSARLTVNAAEAPGFVKLYAITPVSNSTTPVPVAFIDTVYGFEFKTADGLVIKLTPLDKTFAITNEDRDARLMYQAEFYKPGESKPFETRSASMFFQRDSDPQLRMDIGIGDSLTTKSGQQEMDEIGKQLDDPKLTQAQRDALMQRLSKAQMRAMDEMLKGATAGAAAAADKARDDFGCRLVQIDPGANGAAKATVLCGKNFYKGVLQTTGTMAQVR